MYLNIILVLGTIFKHIKHVKIFRNEYSHVDETKILRIPYIPNTMSKVKTIKLYSQNIENNKLLAMYRYVPLILRSNVLPLYKFKK